MAMGRLTVVAWAVLGVVASAPPGLRECRCTPPLACWDAVPWATLNQSVAGRLHASVDELAACLPVQGGELTSPECAAALLSTDNGSCADLLGHQTTHSSVCIGALVGSCRVSSERRECVCE